MEDAFQRQKFRVLRLIDEVRTLASARGNDAAGQRLTAAERRLQDGKLMVVVLGWFKQGKSSLMNALVEEPDLFPVDIDITTSLVSMISYGPREVITVRVGEPGKERTVEITRDEIPSYVTEQGNPNNTRRARLLHIETPNPKLREGLVLVDTPGVEGLNTNHTDISYGVLANADAVLFVSDVQTPLTDKELRVIERIARQTKNIVFVVTKTDLVRNASEIVENNRAKLAAALDQAPDEIVIVPVSSKLKLSYLETEDQEDLDDSGFAELEAEVWQRISERGGRLLLFQALQVLAQTVAELRAPLDAELTIYQNPSRDDQDKLAQDYQAAIDRRKQLADKHAGWRTTLAQGLEDTRTGVMDEFQKGWFGIHAQTEVYLSDNELLKQPELIVAKLEQDINELVVALDRDIRARVASLQARIEMESGLNLNPLAGDPIRPGPVQRPDFSGADKAGSWWGTAVDTVRRSVMNIGLVGFLMRTIGVAVDPVGGIALLTDVAGGALATKQALSQRRTNQRGAVNKELGTFLTRMMNSTRTSVTESITKGGRQVIADLDAQIIRELTSAEETLKSINEARAASREEATIKAGGLRTELVQYDQLQRKINAIGGAVAAPARKEAADDDSGSFADLD